MSARSLRVACLALVTVMLTAGCLGGGDSPGRGGEDVVGSTGAGVEKRGDAQLRIDVAPLVERFSALGEPVSAEWMSGTLGGSVPGPSTYWIDAVVHLDEERAEMLREASSEQTKQAPAVTEDLLDSLPSGALLEGDGLDALFAESGFSGDVYVSEDQPIVVLVMVGQ